MKQHVFFTFLWVASSLSLWSVPEVLVAVGAHGNEEFGKKFTRWANAWKDACSKGGATFSMIEKPIGDTSPREQIKAWLSSRSDGDSSLWIIFIGHGTFDGKRAKLNLRGPDVSATELAAWIKPVKAPVVFFNTASSSSPFISAISGANRVIITATRSGGEQNFARFGEYLSVAIGNADADLDKDGQTSVLEAFLVASRQLSDFYDAEGRLATEHPLIDDNGDQLGTPPEWFRGVRPVKKSVDGSPDGYRAHQFHLVLGEQEKLVPEELRRERDALEVEVYKLRDQKAQLPEEEYYQKLETILRKIGRIYEQAG